MFYLFWHKSKLYHSINTSIICRNTAITHNRTVTSTIILCVCVYYIYLAIKNDKITINLYEMYKKNRTLKTYRKKLPLPNTSIYKILNYDMKVNTSRDTSLLKNPIQKQLFSNSKTIN